MLLGRHHSLEEQRHESRLFEKQNGEWAGGEEEESVVVVVAAAD